MHEKTSNQRNERPLRPFSWSHSEGGLALHIDEPRAGSDLLSAVSASVEERTLRTELAHGVEISPKRSELSAIANFGVLGD